MRGSWTTPLVLGLGLVGSVLPAMAQLDVRRDVPCCDLEGTAAISFSEKSILGIVSAMFGEEMTEVNEEINDAVGEISNMVAGHVTTKIAEMDKKVKVKFVEVLQGRGQPIPHTEAGSHVVSLPFRTTKGRVVVEVCYADAG